MGHWISKLTTPLVECSDSVVNILSSVGRKRKRYQCLENKVTKKEVSDEPLPKRYIKKTNLYFFFKLIHFRFI